MATGTLPSNLNSYTLLAEQLNGTSNPPTLVQKTISSLSDYKFVLLTVENANGGSVIATAQVPVSFFKNRCVNGKTLNAIYVANNTLAAATYYSDTSIGIGALYGTANMLYARLYGIK